MDNSCLIKDLKNKWSLFISKQYIQIASKSKLCFNIQPLIRWLNRFKFTFNGHSNLLNKSTQTFKSIILVDSTREFWDVRENKKKRIEEMLNNIFEMLKTFHSSTNCTEHCLYFVVLFLESMKCVFSMLKFLCAKSWPIKSSLTWTDKLANNQLIVFNDPTLIQSCAKGKNQASPLCLNKKCPFNQTNYGWRVSMNERDKNIHRTTIMIKSIKILFRLSNVDIFVFIISLWPNLLFFISLSATVLYLWIPIDSSPREKKRIRRSEKCRRHE